MFKWNKIRGAIAYLVIIILAWFLIKGGIHCGPQISWDSTPWQHVEPDTLYLQKPPKIIDSFTERIVYRETSPDTVRVIIYETRPATVAFVSATISDNGWATIEIMINDSTAVVLKGRVEYYGNTYIQVNPDSTVSFINPRFGFSPGISAGVTLEGADCYFEPFYWNNALGTGLTLHPLTLGYERSLWGPNKDSDYGTVGVSADINPWHTPLRVHVGGKLDFDDLWPPGLSIGLESLIVLF